MLWVLCCCLLPHMDDSIARFKTNLEFHLDINIYQHSPYKLSIRFTTLMVLARCFSHSSSLIWFDMLDGFSHTEKQSTSHHGFHSPKLNCEILDVPVLQCPGKLSTSFQQSPDTFQHYSLHRFGQMWHNATWCNHMYPMMWDDVTQCDQTAMTQETLDLDSKNTERVTSPQCLDWTCTNSSVSRCNTWV